MVVLVAQELNKSPFFKIIIPNYNNGKWLSSMYRYCADLMDLQCKTSYCEAHRVYRMETAQKDIKNNITRQ